MPGKRWQRNRRPRRREHAPGRIPMPATALGLALLLFALPAGASIAKCILAEAFTATW